MDSATGSQILSWPSGLVSGDLVVAPVMHRSNSTAITAPSNALTWADTGASTSYQKIYTATYDGIAAAPTIDTASIATYGRLFALRSPNPIVVDVIDDSGAGQANMHYPAVTLTNGGEFVVTFCRSQSALTSVTPDTDFTEIEDFSLTSGVWGVFIQYQIFAGNGLVPVGNPVVTGSVVSAVRGITLAFTEGPPTTVAGRNLLLGVG